jgi:hypothetical protein
VSGEQLQDGGTHCLRKAVAGIIASFQNNLEKLTEKHPESVEDIKTIHAGLVTIDQLIHSSPARNGRAS